MADTMTKKDRSRLMSKVKQKNTKPELIVRKYLYSKGYRYRINVKKFPGSPDILMKGRKIAIFVHGCYWHGHSCRAGKLPSSNLNYWEKKISDNVARDARKKAELEDLGFKVYEIWGCDLKTISAKKESLSNLADFIDEFSQDR